MATVTKPKVTKAVLEAATEYILLSEQKSSIEKRMKELRKEVEAYMQDKGMNIIPTDAGAIQIIGQPRAVVSARYTSYEVDDILKVGSPKVVSECIVERADRDIVDLMIKTGKLPKEVEQLKVMPLTPCFSVKPL